MIRNVFIIFSLIGFSISSFASVNVKLGTHREGSNLEVDVILSSSNAISLGSSSFVFFDENENLDFSKAKIISNEGLSDFLVSGVYTSLSLHQVGNSLHLLLLESFDNTAEGFVLSELEFVVAKIQIPISSVCTSIDLKWNTAIGVQLAQTGEDFSSQIIFNNKGEESFAIAPILATIELNGTTLTSSVEGILFSNNMMISNEEAKIFEIFENGTYHIETSGECAKAKSLKVDVNAFGIEDNALAVFPNPATSNSTLTYTLTEKSNVKVEVFDIVGNKIQTIDKGTLNQGTYNEPFSVLNIGREGIYIVKLQIGEDLLTERVVKTSN